MGNTAEVGDGGAIHVFGLDVVEPHDNELRGNTADGHGGAVAIEFATTVTLTGNTMLENQVNGGGGGAVSIDGCGDVSFDGGDIHTNTATDAGGVQCLDTTAFDLGTTPVHGNDPNQVTCTNCGGCTPS